MITGTSHFPSFAHAVAYYREYNYDDVKSAVERKLAEDEIHIGPPHVRAGERLFIKDNRYHINHCG